MRLLHWFVVSAHWFVVSAASSNASVTTSSGQQPGQPITLQIHHTQQGPRFMIPSGQLSQLAGKTGYLKSSFMM